MVPPPKKTGTSHIKTIIPSLTLQFFIIPSLLPGKCLKRESRYADENPKLTKEKCDLLIWFTTPKSVTVKYINLICRSVFLVAYIHWFSTSKLLPLGGKMSEKCLCETDIFNSSPLTTSLFTTCSNRFCFRTWPHLLLTLPFIQFKNARAMRFFAGWYI